MARSIAEIKKEITDEFMSDEVVRERYGIPDGATFSEVFSKVSLENILFHVHAVRTWVMELLFDEHVAEVTEIAQKKRPHTLQWYRDKALLFQYGYELAEDSAYYDNDGLTDEEVALSRIVTKCSAQVTSAVRPTIQVKVAKDDDPLTPTELEAFKAYMENIADAGLRVVCVSGEPDVMYLEMTVLYDPMVMDSNGDKYIGGKNTVKEVVKSHLASLPFNGVFYPRMLEQELMQQDGIRVAHVKLARAGVNEASMTTIGESYEPFYGAIQCDVENDLKVEYESIQG